MSGSYIKSSSIHESYNRAVHIQATDYILFENNVIYNVMYANLIYSIIDLFFIFVNRGNAMFLSDGIEIGHVFRGNLAVFVRTSSSLLNEDLIPAAFMVNIHEKKI